MLVITCLKSTSPMINFSVGLTADFLQQKVSETSEKLTFKPQRGLIVLLSHFEIALKKINKEFECLPHTAESIVDMVKSMNAILPRVINSGFHVLFSKNGLEIYYEKKAVFCLSNESMQDHFFVWDNFVYKKIQLPPKDHELLCLFLQHNYLKLKKENPDHPVHVFMSYSKSAFIHQYESVLNSLNTEPELFFPIPKLSEKMRVSFYVDKNARFGLSI